MPQGKRTFSEWIRFANSLRLRLAVRIAMADSKQAVAEAQKALTDEEGLLEGNDEVVAVSTSSGYTNPFGEINKAWGEVFMNANMESLLVGYEDPRMESILIKQPALMQQALSTIKVLTKVSAKEQALVIKTTTDIQKVPLPNRQTPY